MGIIDRISQLTRANINDLLDRAEDPEKMLNQILRDMESNIQQARAQVADMIAQEKIIEGDLQQTQKLSSEWNDKARRAVTAGRDDLAREALRRKKDNDDNAAIYQQQADAQKQTVDKLKQQLQALESKHQSTLSNRDALIARQRRAKAQQQVTATLSNFSPLDPSQELNRIEQKIRGNEARAAAMTELQDESFDSQFHELDQDVDIETQLAELKTSVGGGSSAPAGAITSGSTSSDSSSSSGGDSGASSGSASGGAASSSSEPAPWDTPNNG